jgi:hypothetical protein
VPAADESYLDDNADNGTAPPAAPAHRTPGPEVALVVVAVAALALARRRDGA